MGFVSRFDVEPYQALMADHLHEGRATYAWHIENAASCGVLQGMCWGLSVAVGIPHCTFEMPLPALRWWS